MKQNSLFGDDNESIVNVATVPMRSPFRYPGGKTWLIPRLRQWLRGKTPRPLELVEPFAGGGIVGLTAIFEDLVEHITMVELDKQVAAVWEAILNGHGEELAERIVEFELTEESVRTVLEDADASVVNRAFKTILKNRVNRGGILAPGASLLKNGEKGKGLLSRWYSETLKKRILDIAHARDKITFIQGDGLKIMRQNAERPEVGNQAQHGLLDRHLAKELLDFALTGSEPDLSWDRQLAALERLSYFAEKGMLKLDVETNGLHLPGVLTLPGRISYGVLPTHTLREPARDAVPPRMERSELVTLFPSEFDLIRRPFWVWGRILEGRASASLQ